MSKALKQRLREQVRRAAKAAWWAVTPWRIPQRLAVLRQRALRDTELEALAAEQHARERGESKRARPVNLFDVSAVCALVGRSAQEISWPEIEAADVCDHWSAVRFCIDRWRMHRQSTPSALAADQDLLSWMRQHAATHSGLSASSSALVDAALRSSPADRARQYFMQKRDLRALIPHGLTPPGCASLLRWYFLCGMEDGRLRPEEVWWLFMEAEADPRRELGLAYLFTPAWQAAHPAGLTVFGREAFSSWFAAEYRASGSWLDSASWLEWDEPSDQLRIAYWANADWRLAHPNAFASVGAARDFLVWLCSTSSALTASQRQWCAALGTVETSDRLASPGLNMLGHFCYPSGLRVSAESLVAAMRSAGGSCALRDVSTDNGDEPIHVRYHGVESHDISVIHVQPEPYFSRAFEQADLIERSPRSYRIAYWYWEFDSIPASWRDFAVSVDEIWTATEFVARGLRAALPIPVHTLFPGVRLPDFEARPRPYFGLAEREFVFLFTFHMMSVMERKNPLGLIRAFMLAFRPDERVRLVLKTSFGERHKEQLQALLNAADAAPNITVIDAVYSANDVLALTHTCDAYVSLHRSEGLGLTMAEAMLMGKPVIATNYSGNVDFMDENNSLLVPCELTTLGEEIPPYDAGLTWAEPSIDQASKLMRRVYDDPAFARELGIRAQKSALATMSIEAAGWRMRQRIEEIRAARKTGTPSA